MRTNPYPGLASFENKECPFYGRDNDITALTNLMITNRTVLFHSPSGAGKSSLIHRGLIPTLEGLGQFHVLPVLRVNENLAALKQAWEKNPETQNQEFEERDWNRFSWSILRSLESHNLTQKYCPLALAQMSIMEYLEDTYWIYAKNTPKLLIFDQFEEVITKRWQDVSAKKAFFYELGIALRNHSFWALFVVREDYVAAMKPYWEFLPTSYPQEYRMELFEPATAKEAIEKPALTRGVTFTPQASIKLLKLLSAYKRYNLNNVECTRYGKWIDPLYLQLVCHRLWYDLENNISEITAELIPEYLDNIDESLSFYYTEVLDKIYGENDIVAEKDARNFIKNKLINSRKKQRRQIEIDLKNTTSDNHRIVHLIQCLLDENFVREVRENTNVYELAHDRMVEPIVDDNIKWFNRNINGFERVHKEWKKKKRRTKFLAERWAQIEQAVDWLVEDDKARKGRKYQTKAVAYIIERTGYKPPENGNK